MPPGPRDKAGWVMPAMLLTKPATRARDRTARAARTAEPTHPSTAMRAQVVPAEQREKAARQEQVDRAARREKLAAAVSEAAVVQQDPLALAVAEAAAARQDP